MHVLYIFLVCVIPSTRASLSLMLRKKTCSTTIIAAKLPPAETATYIRNQSRTWPSKERPGGEAHCLTQKKAPGCNKRLQPKDDCTFGSFGSFRSFRLFSVRKGHSMKIKVTDQKGLKIKVDGSSRTVYTLNNQGFVHCSCGTCVMSCCIWIIHRLKVNTSTNSIG